MSLPDATAGIGSQAPRMFSWKRIRVVFAACVLVALMAFSRWNDDHWLLAIRLPIVGALALAVFGGLERWPSRLPSYVARWGVQVIGVAVAMPFATGLAYWATTPAGPPAWYLDRSRMQDFGMIASLGLLVAPWIAMGALYRQVRGDAQRQALAFDLERSEYQRRELDARLRLLQAQVEPHFLFNTLANIRELVYTGSPRAYPVLGSLIAYLQAAVPRLNQSTATLGQELELARAYLEVMHMRMPDRIQFSFYTDEAALPVQCPPMTVLTLVENAIKHGIDPSEIGGTVEVRVTVDDGSCHVLVADTGLGIDRSSDGRGTGLNSLNERLRIAFSGKARLELTANQPRGTRAEVIFPIAKPLA
jgi:Histidine kinase